MKKVGIMGGTFNPIHFGHLFLAEDAYEQIGLDEILFMPSKNPPHKQKAELVADEHRVNMVKLAIKDNPHFTFSDMELMREGITYTADTMTILKKENPENEYYFIEGADSLFMMQDWMNPQTIFNLCTIVSSNRDNVEEEKLTRQLEFLKKNFNARIMLLDMPTIQIASANIRNRIASGKSVRYYVPDEVLEYIKENRLYDNMTGE
ncbi:MAG TPA: nicotinate-nucleotide adenylyltransferase [Mobilitalea sp.]|nr:nicotinate-nucleotide adenylyltransferase [Mobilitalea sp.]